MSWLGLTLATLLSFALGSDHGAESDPGRRLASLAILAVAFGKVRFVGRWFMELREAPAVMGLLLDAYCAGVFVLLAAMYLSA